MPASKLHQQGLISFNLLISKRPFVERSFRVQHGALGPKQSYQSRG